MFFLYSLLSGCRKVPVKLKCQRFSFGQLWVLGLPYKGWYDHHVYMLYVKCCQLSLAELGPWMKYTFAFMFT